MSYSELRAIAHREESRRVDADHSATLHRVVADRARDGRLLRASRRLLGRGPRPLHVLEGEATPRARSCERPDTASA